MRKSAHFTFWGPKCEKCSFPTFGHKSAKKCSFPHFGSKKSKFRCRNHWFHKHLRPGGKNDPKMRFWAQKCISGPKTRFWAQKCISGTKMLPGEKGARCLLTFPHRCSQIRRVKNEIFVKNLKNISEFCVVQILFYGISHFWEIPQENHIFGALRQTLLKQRRNGAILDQNPQNALLAQKVNFWAKSAILS